jgi:hypothetical protein
VSATGLRPLAAGERRQLAEVAERLAGLLNAADLDDPDETAFAVGWTIGKLESLAEALAENLDGYPLAERLADLLADLHPDGGEDR